MNARSATHGVFLQLGATPTPHFIATPRDVRLGFSPAKAELIRFDANARGRLGVIPAFPLPIIFSPAPPDFPSLRFPSLSSLLFAPTAISPFLFFP